jgi:hypothetical protein
MREWRWADGLWLLTWALASSAWCLTAAATLGPTFDEPTYFERGLNVWRTRSHYGLLQLGTMPLPVDVQTLPLYLWEVSQGTEINTVNDLHDFLFWMRTGNLVFWWLLLWYGRLTGRLLAGPWGGRVAVALLACEPNLLAHAALGTTDISITACLLALLYHFRVGREAGRFRRLVVPGVWFGLAVLAKASAIVYGPVCLMIIELHRLAGTGLPLRTKLWSMRRDLSWIAAVGLVVTFVYCGSDFRPYVDFVAWTHTLPSSPLASALVWLAEHLCIFSNAAEGILRQISHNRRGHGTFLLGESYDRAVWYYFPVLLTIKLSVPLLVLPLGVAAVRARALANWACLACAALIVISLTFRVQLGIRMVLPLVAVGIVGLAAAAVDAVRWADWRWVRAALLRTLCGGIVWTTAVAASVWPHALCYVNPLWGGTEHGYLLVSDSNYDWGQGLPELRAWQRNHGGTMDLWYFGRDPAHHQAPWRPVAMESLKIDGPADVLAHTQGRYLAVSTTCLYGRSTTQEGHWIAAAFLRECWPVERTTTFLIYEREHLAAMARQRSGAQTAGR